MTTNLSCRATLCLFVLPSKTWSRFEPYKEYSKDETKVSSTRYHQKVIWLVYRKSPPVAAKKRLLSKERMPKSARSVREDRNGDAGGK